MRSISRPQEISVFDFEEYKACLNGLLEHASSTGRGQRSALAAAIGCQPAYVSRVLNGDADFSLEQAEATARYFVLNRAESAYFVALVGEQRAATEHLRAYWRDLRKKARSERLELKNRVELEQPLSQEALYTYFGSWHFAAIHASVSLEHLQTVEALSEFLNLPDGQVRAALEFLCSVGLVKHEGNRFVTGKSRVHLDKSSPLVSKHHLNWKLKSMEALNHPLPSDLHYTSVVTLSRSDLAKVKEALLQAIESVRGVVRTSTEETLACYSVELFELNRTNKNH